MRLIWISLGGAIGTAARYLVGIAAPQVFGTAFPFGTLIVNALGSFLLGLIMQVSVSTNLISPTLRLVLTTGVMGGFTTYSTFNYETLAFLREGAWMPAMVNVAVTLLLCLAGGVVGIAAGRSVA
jgi:fluoride exporter